MNSKRLAREFPLHLMVLPSFVLVLIFSYGPILGLIIAFKKYSLVKGILGSKWNGLENYTYLFQMPDIWIVIRNTGLYCDIKNFSRFVSSYYW